MQRFEDLHGLTRTAAAAPAPVMRRLKTAELHLDLEVQIFKKQTQHHVWLVNFI